MDIAQKSRLMLFPRMNKWILIVFIVVLSGAGIRG